jgi:hypothetical protein
MKILQKIKEANVEKHGAICDNEHCGFHEEFCRCELAEARRNKRMDIIGQNGNEGEHYEENN